VSKTLFTGERLHAGDARFALDLARHEAAYQHARRLVRGGRVLDLGCGSGYGTARLAVAGALVVGIDRIAPDAASRAAGVRFARADLRGIPLRERSFDLIVSFQVIEHLDDPTAYLAAIAGLLGEDGLAMLSTPNLAMSDGVNPYHVHEYRADELEAVLRRHFGGVEMLGVGTSDPVRRELVARSRRIRRIMRLDPLRLRDRLPRALVLRLFAAFALLVRRGAPAGDARTASWRDFPIGPHERDPIDLLAVCRQPRLAR
jgi:2-polyprenyl-3-methyl-5-hydroxy-6-metoxy-1,4-benzoquinol methylase